MKYIDADELIAEIDRQKIGYNADGKHTAEYATCRRILDIIARQRMYKEQPEVDLEKEIEEHVLYMPHGEYASDNECAEDDEWAREEFRHFYELGRKARKGDNK